MQLAGNVAEDVRIEAVLSDQNTPIQPDGSTQRLNDLDRVFIEMQTPFGGATMGDFEYSLGDDTFAEFSRKLQGASANTSFSNPGGASTSGHVSMAGAVSRGTYRFQQLDPVEGLQGPYRLTGKHGEPFIIVVAGSERVYLDGQELTRGSSNDYVIDYATGELTFTPRHLITSDSRIAVEYEYTTNRYTRTLLGGEAQTHLWPRANEKSRAQFGVRALREADSRLLGRESGFSSADSAIIADAGDSPAISSGARKVPFDSESAYVQYVRRDTLYQGQEYTVFAPVRARIDSVYRVRFTRVESDSASYRRATGAVNGIAYEWAGPGNGRYEPVRVLPKPRRRELVDVTGAVRPIEGIEVFGEWAQSLNDENRLSNVDAGNDRGGAYHLGLRVTPVPVEFGSRNVGEISGRVSRRQVGATFQPFGRTRSVEFGREWNLPRRVASTGSAVSGHQEIETQASLRWSPLSEVAVRAGWGELQLGPEFSGERRTLELTSEQSRWPRIEYDMAYITSRDASVGQDGHWLQHEGSIRQPLLDSRLTPFMLFAHERRVQEVVGEDRLALNSIGFQEWQPGIEWREGNLSLRSSLEYRREERPDGAILADAGRAWTGRTRVEYRRSSTFRTGGDFIYRDKDYRRSRGNFPGPENSRSVVLRWNTRWQPLQRAVQLNSRYEAITRRSPIRQETYVRTGVELGEYVWEDANGDGIRQVDEFLPERTPYEGDYAKTFVPSDELVPVIKGHGRMNLRFDPGRRWNGSSSGWARLLQAVTTQTTIDILEESTTPRFSNVYLMRVGTFRERDHTVNGHLRLSQRVDLFRNQSAYGSSLSYEGLRSMNRRATGYEQQYRSRWTLNGRFRPMDDVGTRLELRKAHDRSHAQRFSSRSYDIRSWTVAPELSMQWTTGLKTTIGIHRSRKTDAGREETGGRTARVLRIPFELQYRRQQRWIITGRFERSDVQLDGSAVGMAAYQLTDGRGPGTSFLWNGTVRYTINRFLNASLIYDGRIPEDVPPVHTVRMEVSATF
jgi:hypothetical protein